MIKKLFGKKKTQSIEAKPEYKKKVEINYSNDVSNSVAYVKKIDCCGCGACYNICPVNAIEMVPDEEGFLYPLVNEDCINCGKCLDICPVKAPDYSNSDKPESFAAYASDKIRKASSSGGIFTVLANAVLEEGGKVCGAGFDENFYLRQMIIDSKSKLTDLKGSKYIQSDTKDTFKQIKTDLDSGKPFLFCGCPCQVAGLKAYLHNDYDNLITLDLLCHGGPSQEVFNKYREDVLENKSLKSYDFRSKEYYPWGTGTSVDFSDGSHFHTYRSLDPFYKAFAHLLSVRPHCGVCKFSVLPRQGDITLGDFWGISKFNAELNDGNGTSMVLVNNKKGLAFFEKQFSQLKVKEKVPLDFVLKLGQPIEHPFKAHKARDRFFDLLQKYPFEKALKYALERKFDVGIHGVWSGCNYGSIMTYYSLYRVVESFGLSAIMIEKPKIHENDVERGMTHSRRFAFENYKEISNSYKLSEFKLFNKHCDAFIIGSDQVWNYGIARNFGRSYFFDFAEPTKKKIAYASSFGHNGFFAPQSEKDITADLVQQFDHVSVREADGVRICKDAFGVEATQVLDPVFVVDKDVIDGVAAKSKRKEEEKFLVTYILDPTPEKRAAILHLSEKLDVKAINMLDGLTWKFEENRKKLNLPNTIKDLQVEDWLYYFKNSEYIITDSCHGASFAILFNKPFCAIANKHRGISRFESLFGLFDLKHRYVTDAKKIINNSRLLEPINFDKVNCILEKEKKKSKEWLREALFSPKEVDGFQIYSVKNNKVSNKTKG